MHIRSARRSIPAAFHRCRGVVVSAGVAQRRGRATGVPGGGFGAGAADPPDAAGSANASLGRTGSMAAGRQGLGDRRSRQRLERPCCYRAIRRPEASADRPPDFARRRPWTSWGDRRRLRFEQQRPSAIGLAVLAGGLLAVRLPQDVRRRVVVLGMCAGAVPTRRRSAVLAICAAGLGGVRPAGSRPHRRWQTPPLRVARPARGRVEVNRVAGGAGGGDPAPARALEVAGVPGGAFDVVGERAASIAAGVVHGLAECALRVGGPHEVLRLPRSRSTGDAQAMSTSRVVQHMCEENGQVPVVQANHREVRGRLCGMTPCLAFARPLGGSGRARTRAADRSASHGHLGVV
mmetsp:Transcript_131204/g.379529  ORF Transcript_131204/g.379529 Transcript_131204/m.379529 type:complete len:348 (+) Transcript_131204:435-1478(+)